MARHTCGIERSVLGFTHGCSLARSAARYPPYQTCHRRFQQWQRSGLLTRLLQKLAEDLRDRGKLDLSEAFIDASFSSAKKGLCCRPYKTRQRQQNHGNRRPPWSSSRRARGQRFAE